MNKSKGTIFLTILEALGGLFTIAASVGALFVKDEPETQVIYKLEDKNEEDK